MDGGADDTGGTHAPRFALHRVDIRTWVILDTETHDDQATRRVAGITITDEDDLHVVWLVPTPLPVSYATPEDVLESLVAWHERPHGGTKPIPIPHYPPSKRPGVL